MLYIMESLSPGEHIIQPTGYHWMYVFQKFTGFLFFVAMALLVVVLGAIYHNFPNLPPWKIMDAFHDLGWGKIFSGFWSAHISVRIIAFILIMMGIMQFVVAMVVRATTEIAVTNRRLIFKQGIIARKMNELKIENIEGIVLNQTLLGRVFNYGQMSAHGTGIGEIHFPDYMADPVSFRRAIQSARTVVATPEPQSAPLSHNFQDDNDLSQAVARHQRGSSVDI